MTDRPIIFSGPMVRALLEGRKTMTRRLAWRGPFEVANFDGLARTDLRSGPDGMDKCWAWKPTFWQCVEIGDCLWVRESIKQYDDRAWFYSADQAPIELDAADPKVAAMAAWAHHRERDYAPSIHMPRMFSRLTLTVTAARVERLQGITEEEAFAEGIQLPVYRRDDGSIGRLIPVSVKRPPNSHTAREFFASLWCELHGKEAWDANPEVVALTFSVHQSNIDALQVAA